MPLTQPACDVSQTQVERETVQSVFSYAAAVSVCTTCLSLLPNLGMWYTEGFRTPGVILEVAVETDTLILALKIRECRNKLFGKSRYDVGPGSCFHPGWHSFKHQCLHSGWRCPESHWHLHNMCGVCTTLSIHPPSHTHTAL